MCAKNHEKIQSIGHFSRLYGYRENYEVKNKKNLKVVGYNLCFFYRVTFQTPCILQSQFEQTLYYFENLIIFSIKHFYICNQRKDFIKLKFLVQNICLQLEIIARFRQGNPATDARLGKG